MKRIAFLFGIGLLALAFLVTGAELAARTILSAQHSPQGGGGDVFMSTRLVWRTVAPHSYLLLLNSAAWPVAQHLLALPAWILFGVPGLTLAIGFRTRDTEDLADQQDQAYQDDLYLFDELALAAQKEGYDGIQDDRDPSNLADIVPAEDHYAQDPVEAELMAERDFLLEPSKPPHRPD